MRAGGGGSQNGSTKRTKAGTAFPRTSPPSSSTARRLTGMKERGKMKVAAFFQGLPRSDAHRQPSCSSTALARRGDALQHPLTPQSPGSVGATRGSPLTHILDSSQGWALPAPSPRSCRSHPFCFELRDGKARRGKESAIKRDGASPVLEPRAISMQQGGGGGGMGLATVTCRDLLSAQPACLWGREGATWAPASRNPPRTGYAAGSE